MVFVCENQVYALSKDTPYSQSATLTNLYNPTSLGLTGIIKRVFAQVGDPDKMYLVDTSSDNAKAIALELKRDSDYSIRPVFSVSSRLEPTWL